MQRRIFLDSANGELNASDCKGFQHPAQTDRKGWTTLFVERAEIILFQDQKKMGGNSMQNLGKLY